MYNPTYGLNQMNDYQQRWMAQSQLPQFQLPIQQPNAGSIIWVNGIEGAKGYQIPPNSNVLLMDSENKRFYIKTSDNIGMCDVKSFEFQEVDKPTTKNNIVDNIEEYVNKKEFEELKTKVESYAEMISNLSCGVPHGTQQAKGGNKNG